MNRFGDYLYATVPSFCLAFPIAQILPDLTFLQGLEKLGIVGIMGLGIIFFVAERRSFLARSSEKLESVEKRLTTLETKVSTGNDKMVSLLGQQLSELKEIKIGQAENFARMWQLTLHALNGTITDDDYDAEDRLQTGQNDVFRPCEGQAES